MGAPGIYVFGHFLDHPNVKALKGSNDKHNRMFNALELFAYGTYDDYDPNKKHPKLNDKQLNKLKKLSIVSEAERSKTKILNYGDLIKKFKIGSVRELEDFIIECIYEGLIEGRLDQKRKRVEILFSKGRDIGKKDVTIMKNKLLSWLETCDKLMKNLDNRINQANASTDERMALYTQAEEKIQKTTEELINAAAAEKMQNQQ